MPGPVAELRPEALRAELDTNLYGPMLLTRRVLPGLVERRRGDLVFMTSLNAVLPRPLQAGYTASKAGLEGFVRVLQMELEGSGVRASIVRPGPITDGDAVTPSGASARASVIGPANLPRTAVTRTGARPP